MKKRIFMQFPFMGKDGKECENNEWFPECPEAEMLPRTGITVILCFFFSGESHAVSRYLRKRKSEFSSGRGFP